MPLLPPGTLPPMQHSGERTAGRRAPLRQVDATISQTRSGGAVLDSAGNLMGLALFPRGSSSVGVRAQNCHSPHDRQQR